MHIISLYRLTIHGSVFTIFCFTFPTKTTAYKIMYFLLYFSVLHPTSCSL
jgi:hypothetical protein